MTRQCEHNNQYVNSSKSDRAGEEEHVTEINVENADKKC